jgi:hypothetical protein
MMEGFDLGNPGRQMSWRILFLPDSFDRSNLWALSSFLLLLLALI